MRTGLRFYAGDGSPSRTDRSGSRDRIFGPTGGQSEMCRPHISLFSKIEMVRDGGPTAPQNAFPVHTEPSFVHQVLAGAVHAVRGRFV